MVSTKELVDNIIKGKNVKAKSILKKIVQLKVKARLSEVVNKNQ